ncbi:AAA family ATPase [uncultured Eubacterium sp.]|uniref:AAA family ATPase n=1 Tax=uncultured Eubacterium sp. TaxID=165185 RepID=UPI0025DD1401|nr:AAA family ATPase [uncultured Eubacterium sp.]MCI6538468.1 ATP-binding protein [Lachnospiraceae bacterium]
MDSKKKKLPLGIENFEDLIRNDFYYIDKTGLIRDILEQPAKVTLFTRPRRFGKSLNMSMLEKFFSPESNKHIFDGLVITQEKELCEKHMGRYPVISVSLKGINAPSYDIAFKMLVMMINESAEKVQYLRDSKRLTEAEKGFFEELLSRNMDEATAFGSLRLLSRLLYKHHGQPVIVLIDEYDVPLAKAFSNGYYEQMVFLIRNLFEQVLKTNDSLHFAILTGCMRISKESIFTGLNNLSVRSVTDLRYDEYFGFTDTEVRELLDYYGFSDCYDAIKEWYDGYQFGNTDVYCPWDVMNYCDALLDDCNIQPENYWVNTSSNDAVRKFIEECDNGTTRREIERLIAGETIEKEIYQELTYQDMYASIDHIWSVLFTTGYLTQKGKIEGNRYKLAIPNLEIRNIYTTQIMALFQENVKKDGQLLTQFCNALEQGNTSEVENCLNLYLRKTISIRDTFVKKQLKENFYHGILVGILGLKDYWGITSNRETGDGYSDIVVETENSQTGIVLEMKYAQDGNLEAASQKAVEQIEKTNYAQELQDEGIDTILKYGIAFYKKRCKVKLKK